MKAMTYDKGVMHGQAASFFENGQQASQRMFQAGKETYRRQWDQNGKMLADGPVRQTSQPKGRTHLWTQQTISDYCKGKTSAEIETLFGKADGSGTGGAWIYRSIKVLNPQTKKSVAATVHFTFLSGKIAQTKITAQQ
jgi:antitoxin component YwqK of YwqJK toxin-antitoxin module